MISLKQLHYALAVDQTRHFKRAAEQCAISQSALSTAISELETQLGLQIFERSNKQVLVTPEGERLLTKARQVQLLVDDLYHLADSRVLSYPMSIGVIPTVGPYLLPKALPAVRAAYPDSKLSIVEGQSAELVDKVRDGELDTAILALPYPTPGLHCFEFWAEDFYLVTHRDDELARFSRVSASELDPATLLLLKEGHCLKEHALAACKLPGAATQPLAGTSLYTLTQMVASRLGTTLVPAMALDALLRDSSELKAVPLSEPGPHRRIAFIARLNYARVADVECLMRLFREALSA